MERQERIVQVMLKPNCGLENTRASLVVRRIAPLCDTVSCHPRTVKSDRRTIDYLRDHGLFVRFATNKPEQVLLAIKGAFFVDSCTLVDDPASIPPFAAPADSTETEAGSLGASSPFADHDERGERDDELADLLARFEGIHHVLRSHLQSNPHDRVLNDAVFSHAQALDALRTAVERSRIEPFDRIAPSLHALADDYSKRFGVAVRLDVAEGRVALDRSVLASMEEIIKCVIRSCIRDGIESPDKRLAAGKPECATIRLRVENDGSDVVCRIEHDGTPFSAKDVGELAFRRGLLTRPLDTYTDEEIGSFLLMPRFVRTGTGSKSDALSRFSEIGSMLRHVGGHGKVRNTERGTMEIALYFPVPFTVLEVALLRTGETLFALPAQQIKRFEAFLEDRLEASKAQGDGACADRFFYASEDDGLYELLNWREGSSPIDAADPRFAILLDVLGAKRALVVDAVDGYERVSVNQLPQLLDRGAARAMGCIGYAMLEDGSPRAVVSARRFLSASNEGGRGHA
ncbi:chemotaxis protein CheA [Gordonibacter sp. 28C]|uniref:chemotaxis protein CheA n=1 Tax=Gordonibacter sp. 28C TaxID=2078569 RepID=UPI000DF8544B|nr:chemotaxis protein CheA [Gordonibacter sp. 28C]RDB58667.1 chemotaxis protein CheA [Gordonibacter sp. 28C]